jgi:aspartate kinase
VSLHQSNEHNPAIVIQKYGGSTIGDPMRLPDIVNHIRSTLESGQRVVVVVSAMGRQGDPYATETLLSLLPEDQSVVCRRERDLLMACGEILSAVTLSCKLRQNGIPAIARAGFEAGIITDNEHGNAKILTIQPAQLFADLALYQCVVVAGFQGLSETGRITTLGRGGSDTSAVAIGVALNADRVEVFTDTEGIYSADPHTVEGARLLHTIDAEDIRQMAWQGTKVLHPRAAELITQTGIKTIVGRVDHPDACTEILSGVSIESRSMITAVTCGPSAVQITVYVEPESYHADATRIFETVTKSGISMDMFTLTEQFVRFTVQHLMTDLVTHVLQRAGCRFELVKACVKVSIIGVGMHGMKGVMARFSRCLLSADVPILQTVDSHATISALIPEDHRDVAEKALHREFIDTEQSE